MSINQYDTNKITNINSEPNLLWWCIFFSNVWFGRQDFKWLHPVVFSLVSYYNCSFSRIKEVQPQQQQLVFANPPQPCFLLTFFQYPCNYSCLNFFCMFWSKNNSHLNQYTPPVLQEEPLVGLFPRILHKKTRRIIGMLITLWGKEKGLLIFFLDSFLKCSAGWTQLSDFSLFAHFLNISLSHRHYEDVISLDKLFTWNRLDQQSCRKDLSLLQSSFDCVLNLNNKGNPVAIHELFDFRILRFGHGFVLTDRCIYDHFVMNI